MKAVSFKNYGFIRHKISPELYYNLVKEVQGIHKDLQEADEMVSGITAKSVPKQWYLKNKDNIESIKKETIECSNKYLENFLDAQNNDMFFGANKKNLIFDIPWVNFQKKGEFIPFHKHGGVWSFNIWLNIPYDSKEETSETNPTTSTFNFFYNDALGTLNRYMIKLDQTCNGQMIFFPAGLYHVVYPFFSTEETRVSIAGNILYE